MNLGGYKMPEKLSNDKIIYAIRHDIFKKNEFIVVNEIYRYDESIRPIIKKSVILLNSLFAIAIFLLIFITVFLNISDSIRYLLIGLNVMVYLLLTKVVVNKSNYQDLNKYVHFVSKTRSSKNRLKKANAKSKK
jgi:hypothetical protein